jgi:hypothetical protein
MTVLHLFGNWTPNANIGIQKHLKIEQIEQNKLASTQKDSILSQNKTMTINMNGTIVRVRI